MSKELKGQELVDRYKSFYKMPDDCEITEEMVLRHWELEQLLTRELLDSIPESRWEVTERCYSTLFGELDWLNRFQDAGIKVPASVRYEGWPELIGSPPQRVYEIGSGKGELISYLAENGFICKATEITRERGQKWVDPHPNLTWSISDGVHLERFEEKESWDVVISNQVIEHLHPGDLVEHFKGALHILRKGGRYIFCTPHFSIGPKDVSAVFGCDKSQGLHLKEYKYSEISNALKQAGFSHVYAPLRLPQKVRKLLRWKSRAMLSEAYISYLCVVERFIESLPLRREGKRKIAIALRAIRFSDSIWMIAQKEQVISVPEGVNNPERIEQDT